MAMLNISQLLSTGEARRVNLYRDGKNRKQFGYKVVNQDKHKKNRTSCFNGVNLFRRICRAALSYELQPN